MAENEASFEVPLSVKQPILKVAPEEASKLIRWRLEVGNQIGEVFVSKLGRVQLYSTAADLDKWDKFNTTLLKNLFTTMSFATNYGTLKPSLDSITGKSLEEWQRRLTGWFLGKITALESIDEQLVLFDKAPQSVTAKREVIKPLGSKVFIVHGHDEAVKQSVARFLEHLDLDVVILHEKPDRGRTTIEKLVEESDMGVGYAVVLLTGDDVGKLVSEGGEPSPRARQNVILELGYFLAKLGRERVHALYQEGVELPSDYDSVLYTPLRDPEAWKLKLAIELKAVGFNIDLNKLTK